MLPHELIGRNYAANPDQGNGRSSRDYGNTGPLEYDPWPERDTRPSCEAVQSAPIRHFALCGFVIGVLVALYLVRGF